MYELYTIKIGVVMVCVVMALSINEVDDDVAKGGWLSEVV